MQNDSAVIRDHLEVFKYIFRVIEEMLKHFSLLMEFHLALASLGLLCLLDFVFRNQSAVLSIGMLLKKISFCLLIQ